MSLQDPLLVGFRRIGVAVSGGADSVFLLHALVERGLAAAILHVNHKLRGEEAELDERFVRELAARFELPVFVAARPVANGNIEQEARSARYVFFEAQIAAGHCDAVATGHTKEDQAETVLGRFLRGAGTAGLSGIRPRTEGCIVRPLLDLGREEIRASLRERGIEWREDASNLDTAFLRNRIRHEIMPQLAELNPSLADVLAGTAECAQDEEDYWRAEVAKLETQFLLRKQEVVLARTGDLTALPVALQRRLIRRMIERVRGSLRAIDFRHGEAIRRLIYQTEGSGRIQLPELDVYRSFDWLRMAPPGFDSRLERDFEVSAKVPGVTNLSERGISIVTELAGEESVACNEHVYNEEVYALDQEKCAGSLLLRNWRPGDRFQPVGRESAEKIKTLFQESRVPLWERRSWPVIVRDQSIVWTRRFGASGDFSAGPESRRILLIREAVQETRESNTAIEASIDSEGRPERRGPSGVS